MTIIAGTDGTDRSMAAVEWAAAEAQRRRTVLRIVHAFDWDWRRSRFAIGTKYVDVARELAEAVVVEAHDRAREVAPDIVIDTDTLLGHAAPQLLDIAAGAELLAVGSRGRGGFTGLLLGSVCLRLAAQAPCPVAVIPGRRVPDGPVVAGLDDSPTADHVLAAAFDAAAGRAHGLTVLRSFAPAVPPWLAEIRRGDIPTAAERQAELDRIADQLGPWREKYPGLPVETVLTHESPAAALVRASHGAQLVVIGSRAHGAAGGVLLGATGIQVLHHAPGPVLVARGEDAR